MFAVISRAFLLSRPFLGLLFVVNAAGTVYGYYWYGSQLIDTAQNHPLWQLPFVPDSPTASLFFTLSLLYLLFPPRNPSRPAVVLQTVIEALGVITSVKYGIWAVVMIFAGASQGDPLEWQHIMLIISHLGMAVEALLYCSFMRFGKIAAFAAGCWLLLNDTVDYTYGVYPWLPSELEDDLPSIEAFTYGLSLFSLFLILFIQQVRRIRQRYFGGSKQPDSRSLKPAEDNG